MAAGGNQHAHRLRHVTTAGRLLRLVVFFAG